MLDKFSLCLLFFCSVQVFAQVPPEEWTPEMSRDLRYTSAWKQHVFELQVKAHAGDRHASRQLKNYSRLGYGRFGDYRSVPALMENAAAGEPAAMSVLGQIYLHGDGAVEMDVEKGKKLVRAAAEAGNASAMFELAMLYKNGMLLERDGGAHQSDLSGQASNVTRIDESGRRVAVEAWLHETVKWLEKGRAVGDLDAIFELGRLSTVSKKMRS